MTPAKKLIMMGRLFKNLVSNGNLSDGIAGWSVHSGTTATVTNGELVITTLASTQQEVYKSLIPEIGHNYYVSVEIKSDSNQDGVAWVDGYGLEYHSGSGNYETLSFIAIYDVNTYEFRPFNSSRSGDISANPVKIKNIILVDITDLPAEQKTLSWCNANITPKNIIW